jgi:HD-like signal output (HDOD) protein
MPAKRILFVDDEPHVLSGLQRIFRPLRDRWEASFAGGGAEALDLLESGPFHVVVSDMRMPGMDGAALLREVMQRHPRTVRLVLSGHGERESVLRAAGVAHRYLAKPCSAEELRGAIDAVAALDELLADGRLRSLASRMKSLPSVPELYGATVRELQSADPSLRKIADLISRDTAMTAKVLQIVNSAYFGHRQTISNPALAVNYLGLDIVMALVLSVGIFERAAEESAVGVDALWRHSLSVGLKARAIAEAERLPRAVADAAMTAGVLHDVGKLLLATEFPRDYHEVLEAARTRGSLVEAERERFGAGHAELGGYIIGLWGLAGEVVEAVALHHEPGRSADARFGALGAVHVADVLVHRAAGAPADDGAALDVAYLAGLGLEERLDAWGKLAAIADTGEEAG